MKLLTLATLLTVSLLILNGCGAKPIPGQEAVIDNSLPIVSLTQTGIFADMNAIAFEWESIKDSRVKGLYVYRISPDSNNTDVSYYDTIGSRFTTHYVDKYVKPDTQYRYFFKTFSNKAESLKSKTVIVKSLPVLESVSWIHSIENMPRSAKIIWRPHTNEKVKAYRIERKTLEEDDWTILDTVQGRLNAEYIDDNLKDNHVYKYRIRVLTYDDLTSRPSEIVKVITKALPKEVKGIVATNDLPKKIKLTWSKSDIDDFAFYNVYRSMSVDSDYELIATIYSNYYVDEINEDARQFFYRVSNVDKDGLQSENEKNTVSGSTLAKPKPPVVVEAKIVANKVTIFWKNLDHRAKSYTVSKRYKEGWFKEVKEEFEGLTDNKFSDSKIKPDVIYFYEVYAVDKNHIKSQPSIEVKIKGSELNGAIQGSQERPSEVISTPLEVPEIQNQDIAVPTEDLNLEEL